MIIMYIVIITDETDIFRPRKVYGTFKSIEEIKLWLENKFNSSTYSIDIHPLNSPDVEVNYPPHKGSGEAHKKSIQ